MANRVDEAMRAFVGGGSFVACGVLGPEASPSEYEALVKCVVDANRAKKPFLALVQVPGIDSSFALGYAGRKDDDATPRAFLRERDRARELPVTRFNRRAPGL